MVLLGRHDEASERLESARSNYEALKMETDVADVELITGSALCAADRPGEAIKRYGNALRTYEKLGLVTEQTRSLHNRSRAWMSLGDSGNALQDLERVFGLMEEEWTGLRRSKLVGYAMAEYLSASDSAFWVFPDPGDREEGRKLCPVFDRSLSSSDRCLHARSRPAHRLAREDRMTMIGSGTRFGGRSATSGPRQRGAR